MKDYIITIASIPGQGALSYDVNGLLKGFKNEFEGITPEQLAYLLRRGVTVEQLKLQVSEVPSLKMTEVKREITFEDFYEAYNYKKDLQAGKNAWKRLSKADQVLAYNYIGAYERDLVLKPRAKRYSATYLNKRTWEG